MSEQATIVDVQATNVALYRRFIDDGVGIGRLDIIDDVLAPDIELPTLAGLAETTQAGLKQMNQVFRAAFPDLHGTIEQVFAVGDWVAARVTWSGTNTGDFMGQPPTGKTVSITELEIVRCQDGRIVELRQAADLGALMSQLAD
jgi:predicted ester cyclase